MRAHKLLGATICRSEMSSKCPASDRPETGLQQLDKTLNSRTTHSELRKTLKAHARFCPTGILKEFLEDNIWFGNSPPCRKSWHARHKYPCASWVPAYRGAAQYHRGPLPRSKLCLKKAAAREAPQGYHPSSRCHLVNEIPCLKLSPSALEQSQAALNTRTTH